MRKNWPFLITHVYAVLNLRTTTPTAIVALKNPPGVAIEEANIVPHREGIVPEPSVAKGEGFQIFLSLGVQFRQRTILPQGIGIRFVFVLNAFFVFVQQGRISANVVMLQDLFLKRNLVSGTTAESMLHLQLKPPFDQRTDFLRVFQNHNA
jgi:hypothetical protein